MAWATDECAAAVTAAAPGPVTLVVALFAVTRTGLHYLTLDGGNSPRLPSRVPPRERDLEVAARTAAEELVWGAEPYLEQLHTWYGDDEAEDGPVVDVGYLGLLPASPRNDVLPRPAPGLRWVSVDATPRLQPSHSRVAELALERLRYRLRHSNAAVHLLPAEFSLSELQAVYEAILGKTMDKRNFRKWLFSAGMVESTHKERRDGAHRPARLYRFVTHGLQHLE